MLRARSVARWAILSLTLSAVLPAAGHAADALTTEPFADAPLAQLADAPDAILPAGFTISAWRTGLVAPTAVRWAPDGRIFVAQKSGKVVVYDDMADTTPTLYADLSRNVDDFIDRGLLGLAIDPKFDDGRPYIYVSYSYDKDPNSTRFPAWNDNCPDPPGADGGGCPILGRLSRIDPDGTEHVLIQDWCAVYSTHTIGDLHFGPDGALYASGGDGAHYQSADYGQGDPSRGTPPNACGDPPVPVGADQEPPSAEGGAVRSQAFRRAAGEAVTLDGSIIRVDPDTGAALPDNPAAGDANANRRRIVAYGFRNPFRFTFRPGTSELWVGDVGWNTWEEINRVPDTSTVRNFGWPCYEGQGRQAAYDSLNLRLCETLYAQGDAVGPWFQYSHGQDIGNCFTGTSSPTGVAFYTGNQFPAEYHNALFVADYARQCIYVFYPGANGAPDPSTVTVFAWRAGTPVDLQQGPDGALYYADIAGGEIVRLAYPAGEHTPTARATATPDHGPTPLTVSFDGRASSDPDGGTLTYSWDLDGNGTFGDSTTATPTHTYTTPGNYTARLRVTDGGGTSDVTTLAITAGSPPTPVIDAPSGGFSWAVGDPIAYAGHATDGEGDAIPPSGLTWRLDIRHCARTDATSCHTHPGFDATGASGTFTAPNHDWPSHLNLVLTATDAYGLSASTTLALQPKTVNLTLATTPSGGRVAMGSDSATAPFTETFIQNATTDIAAVSPVTIGGASWAFGSWSDGGAITHTITVPRVDSTLTATLVPDTSVTLAGAEGVGTNASSAPRGAGEVYRITASATGTVSRLRLYVDGSSTATALTLGLYANSGSQPTTLLGSGARADVDAGAWNEVSLATPVPVTAGTTYWFALLNPLASNGTLAWRDHAGGASGGAEQTSADRALTGLPAAWAAQASYSDGPVSGYAVGSSGGGTSSPALSVSPTSLAFSATAGAADPAAKTVTVSNSGGGTLDFTTSDDASWLSVTPAAGSAPKDVSVAVDTTGLASGTYTANVTVDSAGASGSPKVIPVTLTVSAAPPPGDAILGGSDQVGSHTSEAPAGAGEAYRFTAGTSGPAGKLKVFVDGSTAASQLVVGLYSDVGGQPTALLGSGQVAVTRGTWNEVALSSGISVLAGTPYWLAVLNPASSGGVLRWRDHAGGATGGAEQTSQGRNLSALPATWARLGSYTDGPLSAYVVGATGPPPPPALAVSPSSLAFSATAGGANPAAKTLSVTNTGSGTLSFSASDDAGWLSLSAATGSAPKDVSVAVDTGGLATGTYTATITVDAGSASGSPRTIPVTLTVAAPAPPALALSPTLLSYAATQGGAAPAAQPVTVSNTGGGTLTYTVADDQPWLSASPASGTAPGTLNVTVDPVGLAPGSYTGAVTITPSTGAPQTIAVGLALAAPSTGLVGAWGFDETSGTTAVDSSGKGNAGTIAGATRTAAGKFGHALSFTADGDWVTVADSASLDLTNALTVEGWVNPTTAANSWRTLAVKETPSGLAWALYPFGDAGFPSGHAFTSSELWARGPSRLPVDTWSHVAVTYDGGSIRLYVNGVQVATRAQSGSLITSTRPLRFGGNGVWGEWFRGTLDEIRVYDRALSGAEIQTDMGAAISGL
jgi:glucose/arabinose dehydrogenase